MYHAYYEYAYIGKKGIIDSGIFFQSCSFAIGLYFILQGAKKKRFGKYSFKVLYFCIFLSLAFYLLATPIIFPFSNPDFSSIDLILTYTKGYIMIGEVVLNIKRG